MGYYRDDGCGSDMTAQDDRENCEPVSLLLDVLIPPVTADNCKPQDSEVCHMRKPRKGPDRRLMSVNPNALSSVIQTIRQKGVPDDVSFVAIQEAKVLSREISIRKQDLADLGWDAYINPCNGDANSRSSGVALLARSGWRVTKLTAANTDVRGLNSARLGAWAVEGCFTGGFIIFVAYLVDGEGMSGQNLEILDNVTRGVAAMDRPFLILADWNMTPETVAAHKWLGGIHGKIVRTGEDTMIQPTAGGGVKRAEYDFAVASSHWGDTTRADMSSGLNYTPHSAVTFSLPAKAKVEMVEEIRAPFKFPRGTPFGPPCDPEKAISHDGLQDIEEHMDAEAIDKLYERIVKATDDELARAYGVDLNMLKHGTGRKNLGSTTWKPNVPTHRSQPSAAPDAHIFRTVADKLHVYSAVMAKKEPSLQSKYDAEMLLKRLPRITRNSAAPSEAWIKWQAMCINGIQNHSTKETMGMSKLLREEAAALERRATSRRNAQYVKWSKSLTKEGNQLAFRWIEDAVPEGFIPHRRGGLKSTNEHDRERAKPLVDVWTNQSGEAAKDRDFALAWLEAAKAKKLEELQCIPDVSSIRRASNAIRWGKSYGSDGVHPRQYAILSEELLWAIVNLFIASLRSQHCPKEMVHVVMRLIPKPTGGERAVGIFGSYIRVVLRAVRHSFGAMWMRRSIGHQWFGVEGRSVERAVWTRLTAAGYARARGQSSAAVLYDIQKAFDHIRWKHLIRIAEKRGFPADLLIFILNVHRSTRTVAIGARHVQKVCPSLSIIAGCVFADTMMYLMMTEVVDEVQAECPATEFAVVADDFQGLTVGRPEEVANDIVTIDNTTTRAFDRLDLPLAIKKSVGMVSDDATSKAISKRSPLLAKRLVGHGRNLGVDFSLKKKRSMVTMQARLVKTRRKVKKLSSLTKFSSTKRFVSPCVNSAAAWGVGVLGATDEQIRERRALGHRLLVRDPRGRSATIDFSLAGGRTRSLDVGYELLTAPIYMLARAVWDRWVPLQWIFRQWDAAFATADSRSDWRYVSQTMDAAARSARRLGWTSPRRGLLISGDGVSLNLLEQCPKTIKYAAEMDADVYLRKMLVQKSPELRKWGPDLIPWVEPLRELCNEKPKQQWTKQHQSLVQCRSAGGLWAPADAIGKKCKIDDGRIIVGDGNCVICKEPCTKYHRDVKCVGRWWWRHEYNLPTAVTSDGMANEQCPLWSRCLVPDPTHRLPPPSDADPVWVIRRDPSGAGFGGARKPTELRARWYRSTSAKKDGAYRRSSWRQ